MWVFGYGSLIWRPDFPFEERRVARISGFARRFWQASPDHRGTPERPGRVVTLIDAARLEAMRGDDGPAVDTWGMAYRVGPKHRDQVLHDLDVREVAGYDRLHLPALDRTGAVFAEVLTYRANEQNPNYLGPDSLERMVAQILASHGHSGPNVEYVLRLAEALDRLGIEDGHVQRLAGALRAESR